MLNNTIHYVSLYIWWTLTLPEEYEHAHRHMYPHTNTQSDKANFIATHCKIGCYWCKICIKENVLKYRKKTILKI